MKKTTKTNYITPANCRDCIMGRKEYGVQWCPVHYDAKQDKINADKSAKKIYGN